MKQMRGVVFEVNRHRAAYIFDHKPTSPEEDKKLQDKGFLPSMDFSFE
jgi:hypothetical protein